MSQALQVEPLEDKVVQDVYQAVLAAFTKAARAQGRYPEDAEEVANETILRLLESHQKNGIENPRNWAHKTAANLWKDIGRREKKHVSYSGVRGLSDNGEIDRYRAETDAPGIEQEGYRLNFPSGHMEATRNSLREEMSLSLMDTRHPEIITEQRDLLQKIDPEWREHMEEGYDFKGGKKMDRNTRRRIQRRARALLLEEGEPLC